MIKTNDSSKERPNSPFKYPQTMGFLTQFVKYIIELVAILIFALLLFVLTPRHPCASEECERCRWSDGETTYVQQLPFTPPQKQGMTFPAPGFHSPDGSPVFRQTTRITNAQIQDVTRISSNLKRTQRISAPRLSSPRTTTSPIISKEEFTHILETSPRARKFVHALAIRMVAERQKRRVGAYHRSPVGPKL